MPRSAFPSLVCIQFSDAERDMAIFRLRAYPTSLGRYREGCIREYIEMIFMTAVILHIFIACNLQLYLNKLISFSTEIKRLEEVSCPASKP